jgi:hypothetical protein
MRMRTMLLVSVPFLALATLACDQISDQPIPFPKRAYLGETVSVAIDTDSSAPVLGSKKYTLSRENVRIQLWDTATDEKITLTPRAVVLGASPLGTALGEASGASEVSIAVFDLPTTLPAGFSTPPSTVWIVPLDHPSGTEINSFIFPILEILGPAAQGDGPTVFYPSPPEVGRRFSGWRC